MKIRPGVEWAGLSDIGCLRANNEDSYGYWEPDDDEQFQRKGRLLIVADGMGGHEGGQEASRIAVETVQQVYAGAAEENSCAALVAAFHAAHKQILLCGQQQPSLHGMGTTCTAAVLQGKELHYVHIGDSRLYLLRNSQIQKLTQDHSYVGRLLENGVIGAAEAAVHPHRNVLLKALGIGEEVEPQSSEQPVALQKDDILLLCTDGLWSTVSEDEMCEMICGSLLVPACRALVERAKERGGPDNITVQLLRVVP